MNMQYEYDLINSNITDDELVDLLCEMIDNTSTEKNVLLESISHNEFKSYSVLYESINEINSIDKNLDNKNLISKLKNNAVKVFNWWYKEDPNKQYKTLRAVLKILFKILKIILPIILLKKAMPTIMKTEAGKTYKEALSACGAIADYGISKIPVVSKIATMKITKNTTKFLSKFVNETTILYTFIKKCYDIISNNVNIIDDKFYEIVNKKDLDKNIAELDSQIDALNDKMGSASPELKQEIENVKKPIEKSLANLVKLRNKLIEKENKKIEKQIKKNGGMILNAD